MPYSCGGYPPYMRSEDRIFDKNAGIRELAFAILANRCFTNVKLESELNNPQNKENSEWKRKLTTSEGNCWESSG